MAVFPSRKTTTSRSLMRTFIPLYSGRSERSHAYCHSPSAILVAAMLYLALFVERFLSLILPFRSSPQICYPILLSYVLSPLPSPPPSSSCSIAISTATMRGLLIACAVGLAAAVLSRFIFVSFLSDACDIIAAVVASTACAAESIMHVDFNAIAVYETEGYYPYARVRKRGDVYEAKFLFSNASAVYVGRLHGCVLLPLSSEMEEQLNLYRRAEMERLKEMEIRKTVTEDASSSPSSLAPSAEAVAASTASTSSPSTGDRVDKLKQLLQALQGEDGSGEEPNITVQGKDEGQMEREDGRTAERGPFGDICPPDEQLSGQQRAKLQAILDAEIERGRGQVEHTRAVLAVHCGQLVAESYAGWLNITQHTSLLGWSMTKSVMTTLVGVAVGEGLLTMDDLLDLHMDETLENDDIRLHHLLHMVDGLDYDEQYGMINDPARMLFLERSTAGFARSRARIHIPGERWCYNSGATNLISWMLRQSLPSSDAYWQFPYDKLFLPIGAKSFLMETDSEGIFVGSSFSFATARDWAKFGVLQLQGGRWGDKQIVPSDFMRDVAFHRLNVTDHLFSGSWWHPPAGNLNFTEMKQNPQTACIALHLEKEQWTTKCLPPDTILAAGYKWQLLVIIPSKKLVLIRLGNTWDTDHRIAFLQSVMKVLDE
eukprot:m.182389 g.182389  ORF g.182389 m.182389 type:complete len:657 (-) comp16640_c3_seq4:1312-3282(-)